MCTENSISACPHVRLFCYAFLTGRLPHQTPLMLLLRRTFLHTRSVQLRRVMVSSAVDNKRKMVKIGTHSGSFHCDEALGCFLLRHTDTYRDADIVRTRDESILSGLDVVIDVGGKYDPGVGILPNITSKHSQIFVTLFYTNLFIGREDSRTDC